MILGYVALPITDDCTTRVGVGAVLGIFGAVLVACLFPVAVFALGASAAGGIIHVIFLVAPSLHIHTGPTRIADKSLGYWGALIVASTVGGAVARVYTKRVMRGITSVIGGAGLSLVVAHVARDSGITPWVYVGMTVVLSIVGYLIQTRCDPKRAKKSIQVQKCAADDNGRVH